MTEAEEYFHLTGKQIKGANSGKIFGHVCYAIGKKPFFFLEEEDAVFKLKGKLNTEALTLNGSKVFDPMGKENKGMGNPPSTKRISVRRANWIQIPFKHKAHWEFYAKEAFKLLRTEINK